MSKTVVITGGSSGIGLAAARALREKGCTVFELSRRDFSEAGVTHLRCDVTDEASVQTAVQTVLEREGRIDVLICNAGFGISGAAEFTKPENSRAQLDVNLFGMDTAVRAVLPSMRQNGGGRIVVTSSVAAIVPIPFQLWYSVSKAAINAYVSALSCEVRPFHITVCAVMPGDIATGFTDARRREFSGDDVYAGRIARSVAVMEEDERSGMAPESAGRVLCRVSLKRRVKPFYTVGLLYSCAVLLVKLLPAKLVNRLVGYIYAR